MIWTFKRSCEINVQKKNEEKKRENTQKLRINEILDIINVKERERKKDYVKWNVIKFVIFSAYGPNTKRYLPTTIFTWIIIVTVDKPTFTSCYATFYCWKELICNFTFNLIILEHRIRKISYCKRRINIKEYKGKKKWDANFVIQMGKGTNFIMICRR